MLEAAKNLLLILSAIFPIVDPIGGSPFFLALIGGYSSEARKTLSWRIAVHSFVLLVGAYFVGTYILAFFGISLPVIQVGGGMILVAMGWATLMENDEGCDKSARKSIEPQDVFHRAFYPLTLPLTVGPGSISVAITLGANLPHHLGANLLAVLATVVGSAIVGVSIYICYGFADRLAAAVGESGMGIILRLSSFLLVCIGVQIMWNGVSTLMHAFAWVAH